MEVSVGDEIVYKNKPINKSLKFIVTEVGRFSVACDVIPLKKDHTPHRGRRVTRTSILKDEIIGKQEVA